METDPLEAVRILNMSIARARGLSDYGLADPVVAQLLHSVGWQTVEAVVSDLQPSDGGLTGRLVLFTGRLLVVADIKDAPRGALAEWSASVSLHPRAALRRIEVLSPGVHAAWGSEHLASGTSVLLHYEGMGSPIEVTSRNTKDLDALLTLVRPDLESI